MRSSSGRRPEDERGVRGPSFRDGGGGPSDEAEPAPPPPVAEPPRVTWRKLTLRPMVLVVVLLATWLWFARADLDAPSRQALSDGRVSEALWQHIELTALSAFLVLVIAVPLGALPARRVPRGVARAGPALAALTRATPALGLLALPVVWLGAGRGAALIGIVACAVPPVLSRTAAAPRAGGPTPPDGARGIGRSPLGVPPRVEPPPVVPLVLAGARTALVLCVGTATLAAFGGGGGLGVLIIAGITGPRTPVLLLGSILTVALALLVDWLASLAELLVRPRGAGR
ncbi:permease [Streptomyces sp. NWU49]|uniref:ABC transporter permease n=1 Tax=Streptomyces sp. NWU49 TaxID=2201153 RepID=UPI000D679B94|nr:permease [Streptomyces sp. NWU49]PWJ07046.1 permease [Streptomyces sp. NWU49]